MSQITENILVVIDSNQFQRAVGKGIADDETSGSPDIGHEGCPVVAQHTDIFQLQRFPACERRCQDDAAGITQHIGKVLFVLLDPGCHLNEFKAVRIILVHILGNHAGDDLQVIHEAVIFLNQAHLTGNANRQHRGCRDKQAEESQKYQDAPAGRQRLFHILKIEINLDYSKINLYFC